MQGASNQHIHLPNEKLSQIAESLKSNSQKVQNLKKKMLLFMNNYDKRLCNGVWINEYQYKLYRSRSYYDFSMSFKDAQKLVNSITQDLSSIPMKILKENIDKYYAQLGKCLELLEQCSKAHFNSRPQQLSESFQSTQKYLKQIFTDLDQIYSNFIVIKETAIINSQETTDLSKGARTSSPLQRIRVNTTSQINFESVIVGEVGMPVNDQSIMSEKSNNEVQKANEILKESEHRLKKLKQLLENINQSKDFYQSLDKLKTTYHNQSDNIFDQIEYAISILAINVIEQINKQIKKTQKFSALSLRNLHENMELQQNQLKQQYQQQIRIKNDQIAKLNQDNSKINIEIQKQTELLKQYTQANARLQQSEKKLQLQIKELNKQIETLNGVIARNQVSNGQNMQTFNQEKKKLQDRINELNEEVVQKQTKITAFQNKVKDLEKRFKDLEHKNRTNLASQSQSNEELNAKLKTMEDDLTKKQREYDAKQRECQNLTRDLQDTRKALNEERRKTSSGSSETLKLRAENDKILKEKRDLEKDLEKLKGDLNDLKKKNQDLNDQLKTIGSDRQSVVDELNQNKQFLRQVELAIREKLNLSQEISPPNLSQAIKNFNPLGAVGCKLITSIIIHGYDAQRSAIINKIEAFSGRKIRRTDVLARYPEVKSMIYNVPKEGAFIMLYKTLAGRVVGSFSEGLRKKTFIFAYWTEEEERFGSKTREASQIEFFMLENSSANVSSVDLNDRKYLKYGRDELRINLMSMETISADSHVTNDKYYHDFKWTYIFGDKKEGKIPLDEVQLHKVDLE